MLGQGQILVRGQPVTAVRPLKDSHQHRKGALFQPTWQPIELCGVNIGRLTENELRHEPLRAAH